MDKEYEYRPVILQGTEWRPLNLNHPAPYRTRGHALAAIAHYRRYVSKDREMKIQRRPIGVWEDEPVEVSE